jgi:hypothetical protein
MLPSSVLINILNYVNVEQLNKGPPDYDQLTVEIIRGVYIYVSFKVLVCTVVSRIV